MSKFLPQAALQREFIAHSIRRINGLRKGKYVRAKDKVGRIGTCLATVAAQHGLTVITEAEFEEALRGTSPIVADLASEQQATDAGTTEEPKRD